MRPGVTLYFVRHGETDWNRAGRYQGQADIPLNDTGRGQARRNGEVLRATLGQAPRLPFVASPLSRTRETMEIVRAAMGLPAAGYATDDRLKEVHYGRWEGTLWSDLMETDQAGLEARRRDPWFWRATEGESYADVAVRAGAWLADVAEDTVVVSHGGVSRVLRKLILDLEPANVPALEVPQDRILVLRAGSATWL